MRERASERRREKEPRRKPPFVKFGFEALRGEAMEGEKPNSTQPEKWKAAAGAVHHWRGHFTISIYGSTRQAGRPLFRADLTFVRSLTPFPFHPFPFTQIILVLSFLLFR